MLEFYFHVLFIFFMFLNLLLELVNDEFVLFLSQIRDGFSGSHLLNLMNAFLKPDDGLLGVVQTGLQKNTGLLYSFESDFLKIAESLKRCDDGMYGGFIFGRGQRNILMKTVVIVLLVRLVH